MTRGKPGKREPAENDRKVDFESPRWRESDGQRDEAPGKNRRFRNNAAPGQRGAIDAGGSVPGSHHEDDPAS
jgi:hypothetical protein